MLSVLQWTTFDRYVHTWISEGMQRTESRHTFTFLQHFLTYPFEVTASFIPCVLFLIPLLIYKELRQQIKNLFNNEILMFSFIVVAANFPLYWILPNMRTRYFLPAGPFAAIAVAVFFEFYLGKLRDVPPLINFFRKFLRVFAFSAIACLCCLHPCIHISSSENIFSRALAYWVRPTVRNFRFV